MATRLVIANHKGGVGKTTTAVTLATGFAALNRRVVLIDCDPQGNVADFLGLDPAGDLFDLVIAHRPLSETAAAVPEFPNLSVVRGDTTTADINTLLVSGSRRLRIQDAIAGPLSQLESEGYDVAILDTAPSLSATQVAALMAADWLIIPASPEFASEAGVANLAQTVVELQKQDGQAHLLGILPTMVDSRSKEHAQTIEDIERAFPNLVLPRVRRLIALGEAPRAGKPIWSYSPGSEAAKDYSAVLWEVIRRAGIRN